MNRSRTKIVLAASAALLLALVAALPVFGFGSSELHEDCIRTLNGIGCGGTVPSESDNCPRVVGSDACGSSTCAACFAPEDVASLNICTPILAMTPGCLRADLKPCGKKKKFNCHVLD